MILTNVTLTEYSLDEKNSKKEEKTSSSEPCPTRGTAINIKEITVNMKVFLLKKLRVGQTVEFEISQNLEFSVPNFKMKEDETITKYLRGKGEGEIIEMKKLDLMNEYEDDEDEEIIITLSNGYAENLYI